MRTSLINIISVVASVFQESLPDLEFEIERLMKVFFGGLNLGTLFTILNLQICIGWVNEMKYEYLASSPQKAVAQKAVPVVHSNHVFLESFDQSGPRDSDVSNFGL